MITPAKLAEYFARNVYVIRRQTEGLSDEESLIQLSFRANCLNWTVGHIVSYRNNIARLLGAEPAVEPTRVARYERESEPVTGPGAGILALGELLAELDRTQEQVNELLARLTPEELERQVALSGGRSASVGERLLFFYFHDTYHTGQTELLRQAAGKDDKII
jgi:uncharacterized damage-inducible protein DinB